MNAVGSPQYCSFSRRILVVVGATWDPAKSSLTVALCSFELLKDTSHAIIVRAMNLPTYRFFASLTISLIFMINPVFAEKWEWVHRNFRLNYWVDADSIVRDGDKAKATMQSQGVCEFPDGKNTGGLAIRYLTEFEFDCSAERLRRVAARLVRKDGSLVNQSGLSSQWEPIVTGGTAAAATRACGSPVKIPINDLRAAELKAFSSSCQYVSHATVDGRRTAETYADTTRVLSVGSINFLWARDIHEEEQKIAGKEYVAAEHKMAIKCDQEEAARTESFYFDRNHRLVHTEKFMPTQWLFRSVRPNTGGGASVDLACIKAAAPRTQTPPQAPPVRSADVKSTGSGFFVNRAHVVTNHHVVEGCNAVAVKLGESFAGGKVVAKDPALDVAVITVEPMAGTSALLLSRTKSEELGQEIVVMGYPLAGLLSQSVKVTSGVVSSLSGVGDDRRMMQISAAVQPGNSGGPVLDTQGGVLGVVRTMLRKELGAENVNFAVRGAALRSFLDLNDVKYEQSAAVGKALGTVETAKIGEKATALVLCY